MAFSNKRKNMKKLYNHISKWERKQIEELTQAGNSNKEIAWKLGRSVSTIGRELKRNYGYGARSYDSERAQKLEKQRRQNSKEPRISEKSGKRCSVCTTMIGVRNRFPEH